MYNIKRTGGVSISDPNFHRVYFSKLLKMQKKIANTFYLSF